MTRIYQNDEGVWMVVVGLVLVGEAESEEDAREMSRQYERDYGRSDPSAPRESAEDE